MTNGIFFEDMDKYYIRIHLEVFCPNCTKKAKKLYQEVKMDLDWEDE